MIRAHRHLLRQVIQREGRLLLQQLTGVGYFVQPMLLRTVFIRLTAFAGPKPGGLRLLGISKETDIFAQRMLRPTGRTAENTGGVDGENKLTVGVSITIHNRLPAVIISYA
jgi:hypothetical protein